MLKRHGMFIAAIVVSGRHAKSDWYGLYMLHSLGLVLALSMFHPIRGWHVLAVKTIGFAVTLVLAFASYRWDD
jgi:hypothetical protein